MDIQSTKLELMQLLLNTHKEDVLEQIKRVFENHEHSTWEEIGDDEKAAIEKGLKQIELGKIKPHHEVMAKFRQKYRQ